MSRFRSTNNFLLRCARPDSNAYDVISFLLKILTYRMETSFYCFVAKICSSRKISSRYRLSGDDLNVWSNAICLWERIEKQQINRRGKKNLFLHLWNTRITIECLNLSVSMISIIGFKCEEGKFRNLRKKKSDDLLCKISEKIHFIQRISMKKNWAKDAWKPVNGISNELDMKFIIISFFSFFASSASLHCLSFHISFCSNFPYNFLHISKYKTELLYLLSRVRSLLFAVLMYILYSKCFQWHYQTENVCHNKWERVFHLYDFCECVHIAANQ